MKALDTILLVHNAVKSLSNRTGLRVSEKFGFEADKFLIRKDCKETKKSTKGIRFESGPFEMVYLYYTRKYYFVN